MMVDILVGVWVRNLSSSLDFPSSLHRPRCDGGRGGRVSGSFLFTTFTLWCSWTACLFPAFQAKSCLGNLSQYLWRNLNISPSTGMMSKLFIMWKFSSPQKRWLGLSLLPCGQRTIPCYSRVSCWIGGLTLCSYGRQHLQVLPGGSSDLGGIFRSLRRDCIKDSTLAVWEIVDRTGCFLCFSLSAFVVNLKPVVWWLEK